MSRCFSNNNTIPIKSSKEHTENKRNNSFFCNYANTKHWTKTNISDENLQITKKNIFSLNHYNKITKANNHSNYLNLSKGLFNRKLAIHMNQIDEKDVWKKQKLLKKITQRKMLTVKENIDNENYKNDNCKNNNDNYVYYATNNNIYGMAYLDLPAKQNIYSNFSSFTEDAETKTELMNKPLKKIIPFCFNLHGNNYIKYPKKTITNFGVGFEMFGDFKETVSHPRKSKDPKITLKGINKGLRNQNWQFDNNRAYFWGGNGMVGSKTKWNKNDSLDIMGIPETNKWTLVMDVKFGGTKDEVVGKKIEDTDGDNFGIGGVDKGKIKEKNDAKIALGEADEEKAARLKLDNEIADLKEQIEAMKENSVYLFRSYKVFASKDLDSGVRIRDGFIKLAGLIFNKDDGNKTVDQIQKGYWYSFSFSFDDTKDKANDKINIHIRKEGENWIKLSTGQTGMGKLNQIIEIKDKIELFKETYTDHVKGDGMVKSLEGANWWKKQYWVENGWVKNVYFTTKKLELDDIKYFKKYECEPI
tara:strand:- start:542 stop:2131 length:1590 start_codon:yes stop_codon:yes gene_type:complete